MSRTIDQLRAQARATCRNEAEVVTYCIRFSDTGQSIEGLSKLVIAYAEERDAIRRGLPLPTPAPIEAEAAPAGLKCSDCGHEHSCPSWYCNCIRSPLKPAPAPEPPKPTLLPLGHPFFNPPVGPSYKRVQGLCWEDVPDPDDPEIVRMCGQKRPAHYPAPAPAATEPAR